MLKNKIINIQNVEIKQMDNQIFNNINLEVEKGDFLYLIGETGSGKSSLLKSLYAEIPFTKGKISVVDIDLQEIKHKEVPVLRKRLGIIFQDFQLLNDRTVGKNLEFVLKATGWKDKIKINNRIYEAIESVHLNEVIDKMPYELSGGEQQRAAIARALLNYPDIILADEPTGNLDPIKSEEIIKLLQKINRTGTTIIIATHNYSIIKKFQARTIRCGEQKLTEVDPENL